MRNILKAKLKSGEVVIGTFVGLGHPDVTERLSRLGFDWLLLDGEHSPLGLETLQVMMQAMNGTECVPLVRPQWNDPIIIKRILDIGAFGVLIPWVNTKGEAEDAVRACRYPPKGIRGYGPRRASLFDDDYFNTANDEILVAVQVETQVSLDNIDQILSVEGVDACYIGPWDLSNNLGFGVPPKWDNPRYLAAFDQVLKAAEEHGKPAGMFASYENIGWAVEKGFKFNTVEDADAFLMAGARMGLEMARGEKNR